MRIKLDEYAQMPNRAHSTDAGLDLKSPCDVIIKPHTSAVIDTGVHVELPHGTVGLLLSKSGLNVHHDITCEGVIDEGYTGSIVAKLYNNGDYSFKVSKGKKITQLVVVPVLYESIEIVDSLEESERGDSGFGSSGE